MLSDSTGSCCSSPLGTERLCPSQMLYVETHPPWDGLGHGVPGRRSEVDEVMRVGLVMGLVPLYHGQTRAPTPPPRHGGRQWAISQEEGPHRHQIRRRPDHERLPSRTSRSKFLLFRGTSHVIRGLDTQLPHTDLWEGPGSCRHSIIGPVVYSATSS